MSGGHSSDDSGTLGRVAVATGMPPARRPLTGAERAKREARIAWAVRLGTFAAFVGSWQWYASNTDNPLLATFTEALGGFWDLAFVTGDLWAPMYRSNQAMVIGYIAAVLTAIPLGLASGRSPILDRMADPYVAIFLAVPIAPLIPIVIVALGLGLTARAVVVFFFAFVFMSVNTRAGVRQVDEALPEMATSFGANEGEIWRLIIVPGSSPAIFAGLRIGLGRAIAGMVIVELLLVATGVGRLLLSASGRFDGPRMFGVVMAIVLESLILLAAMRAVEHKMTPWAHDASV